MNPQNRHIAKSIESARACFAELEDLGHTVVCCTVSGSRPIIEILPPKNTGELGGGLHVARKCWGRSRETYVTILSGCQIEWELPR